VGTHVIATPAARSIAFRCPLHWIRFPGLPLLTAPTFVPGPHQ
jgi:hypothetical protein